MTPPARPYERQTSVRALRVGLGGPSLCACPRYRIPGRAISLLAAILVSEPRSAGSCLLAVWLTEAPSHILRDRLARRRRVYSRPLRPPRARASGLRRRVPDRRGVGRRPSDDHLRPRRRRLCPAGP